MSEIPDNDRQRLKQKLLEKFRADNRILKVLLLGSSIHGTENELSDIDVCIVVKNDSALKQILGEVGTIFKDLGPLVDYYNYSPYHFYVVYEDLIPLDIYLISSSLYHIIKSGRVEEVIGVGQADLAESSTRTEALVIDLLLQAYIRNFRLLSKFKKHQFTTLVLILNSIREDNIIPLLRVVYGLDIPHPKAVKLDNFQSDVKELYIASYAVPTAESCIGAIKALAKLIVLIAEEASKTIDVSKVIGQASKAEQKAMAYG